MSTYTTNYNLKKPEGGDAVNIADINGNMDTVDEQLKANSDGLLQTYTKAQMDAFISTINGNISTGDAARYTKTESDGRYSQTSHTHDSRYYTESEMDTKLSGKSDAGHNHDSRYPLIGHTHDDRYYTESEADGKFSAASHIHDDRYYTETEMDTKLSGKSDTSHKHNGLIGVDWVTLPMKAYSGSFTITASSNFVNENGAAVLADNIWNVVLSQYSNTGATYRKNLTFVQNKNTSLAITLPSIDEYSSCMIAIYHNNL